MKRDEKRKSFPQGKRRNPCLWENIIAFFTVRKILLLTVSWVVKLREKCDWNVIDHNTDFNNKKEGTKMILGTFFSKKHFRFKTDDCPQMS